MENKDEKIFSLLNEIPVSKNIDSAIDKGINNYKKRSSKRKRILYSSVIAAVLFISLVSAIRFSPNIASAMYKIPFLQPLVEMIAYDKGIEDILENEYYEEINASVTKDGFTVTVTNVVADESGMIVSYKIESTKNLKSFQISPSIKHGGAPIKGVTVSNVFVEEEDKHLFESKIEVTNAEGLDYFTNKFEFILTMNKELMIAVPFTLQKEIKQSKTYAINQTVTIDNQKFTVKELIISPIRSKLLLFVDPTNSKKILSFNNIKLEDEEGEVWGKIRNGVSSTGDIASEDYHLMLQSNYFRLPEELTIHFSQIEAVDRENEYMLLDFDKKEIISNDLGLDVEIMDNLAITYKTDNQFSNEHIQLFEEIVDAKGNRYNFGESTWYPKENELIISQKVWINEGEELVNPVKLIFNRSLTHLKGEASITVKLK